MKRIYQGPVIEIFKMNNGDTLMLQGESTFQPEGGSSVEIIDENSGDPLNDGDIGAKGNNSWD